MRKNELMIRKPSAMIQTNISGLSLVQRKFINALIHIAQKDGDRPVYSIPLKRLRDICNFEAENNHQVKAHIRILRTKSIEYNILNKDRKNTWVNTPVIGGVRMEDGTGVLEFEIPYFIKQQVLNPEIYAPLDVILVAGFNSVYAIVLYEFLRDYLDSPKVPQMDIDQFRALMGVEDGKYKLFKDLRTYVIDKAVVEVNEKTDLICRYELTKANGNRYSKIQWVVSRKSDPSQEDVPLLEHHDCLPVVILAALPEKHHIEAVFDVLRPYCADNFDEAFVVSNIRYALGKAKKNFPFYLAKALSGDFARAARESVNQEKKIIDRIAEARKLEKDEQERIEHEGKLLYEKLLASDPDRLDLLEKEVRAELGNEGSPFIATGQVRAKIFERLLGIDRSKDAKQESLF